MFFMFDQILSSQKNNMTERRAAFWQENVDMIVKRFMN